MRGQANSSFQKADIEIRKLTDVEIRHKADNMKVDDTIRRPTDVERKLTDS